VKWTTGVGIGNNRLLTDHGSAQAADFRGIGVTWQA